MRILLDGLLMPLGQDVLEITARHVTVVVGFRIRIVHHGFVVVFVGKGVCATERDSSGISK